MDGKVCEWIAVNKGTTQGSVSGPHLFNVFLNDLNFHEQKVVLDKYADDSTIQVAVRKSSTDESHIFLDQFMRWTERNQMTYNSSKCKELVLRKSGQPELYSPPSIMNIEQCNKLKILGVTFQPNCKFTEHIKAKLYEGNKCLYILRSLRKKGLSQDEIDTLFNAIVLSKILYGLSVYGSSTSDLNTVQRFLTRCFKRNYTSILYNIQELLEQNDRNIFKKISSNNNNPLYSMLPRVKNASMHLRKKENLWPKVCTDRLKDSFFNRIIFRYNLAV